jgi:hypothetical protein
MVVESADGVRRVERGATPGGLGTDSKTGAEESATDALQKNNHYFLRLSISPSRRGMRTVSTRSSVARC